MHLIRQACVKRYSGVSVLPDPGWSSDAGDGQGGEWIADGTLRCQAAIVERDEFLACEAAAVQSDGGQLLRHDLRPQVELLLRFFQRLGFHALACALASKWQQVSQCWLPGPGTLVGRQDEIEAVCEQGTPCRQFAPHRVNSRLCGCFLEVLHIRAQVELLAAHQNLHGKGQRFEKGAIACDHQVLLLLRLEGVVGGGDLQDGPVLAPGWTAWRGQAQDVVCDFPYLHERFLHAAPPRRLLWCWHASASFPVPRAHHRLDSFCCRCGRALPVAEYGRCARHRSGAAASSGIAPATRPQAADLLQRSEPGRWPLRLATEQSLHAQSVRALCRD